MSQPQVTIFVKNPGNTSGQSSYFDINLSGNNYLTNLTTTFDAWCLDSQTNIGNNKNYTATIYSSYEIGTLGTVFPGVQNQNNLDLVNWIINQNFTSNSQYNYGEIQAAIWTLLGDTYNPNGADITASGPIVQSDVNEIIAEAQANGENFVPDNNEFIGVILDPVDTNGVHKQPIIIQVKAAKLGDFVWEDKDADGIQDAGENGIAGTTVNLVRDLNSNGTISANEILATTTTDINGSYQFKGLTPGLDYQVQFIQPNGFDAVSPQLQGGNPALDSNGLLSNVTILSAGEFNQTLDSGFYKLASLGDKVFIDANGNGIQDTGDAGLGGVTVELINPVNGNVIGTTTTDANGGYLFNNLTPGEYQVKFTPPSEYNFTSPNVGGDDSIDSDANVTTGVTQSVTLTSGEFNGTVDAGLVLQKASLGDFVWEDLDADGIQDANEPGIAGATVNLVNPSNGNVIGTTTTGANGEYGFTNLNPGNYQVDFITPNGFTNSSPVDAGGNDAVDSDGTSVTTNLSPGENDPTLDSGFYKLASLGDKVFIDANGNGIQDTGDTGLGGVTVELINPVNGNVIGTTTTDANGGYLFNNLTPGEYQVKFTPPSGYNFTSPNVGGDDSIDSDANVTTGVTQSVTLTSGEFNGTVDAGLVLQKASLGDFVWEDLDADGIQDANEPGIAGATVNLVNPSNGNVIGTTTTGANGEYGFTNLNPGNYQVDFITPNGFTNSSPVDAGGNDAVDSDGTSVTTNLSPGENDPTLDSGFYKLASLGDKVFIDANGNGIQDTGDTGLGGVTVELINPVNGNVIGTTTTDANGGYLFNNLTPGEYQVKFTPPSGYNFTSPNVGGDDSIDSDANVTTGVTQSVTLTSGEFNGTVDAGLVLQKASLGDFVWEDLDADGIQDANEPGIAGATVNLVNPSNGNVIGTTTTGANGEYGFTNLNPGNYQVDFITPNGFTNSSPVDAGGNDAVDSDGTSVTTNLSPGENDPTLDSGFYKLASLGDKVFIDANGNGIQDTGDTGLGGVTVELINPVNGNVIGTTTTDANGGYLFNNLTPGEYQVKFTPPSGYNFTSPNVGGDDSIDSDANVTTGVTQSVTLTSGEFNGTVDAGLVLQKASLGDFVWEDLDADGIQDANEPGIAGATVNLVNPSNGNVIGTTTTGANGEYGFTNLNPGNYQVDFITPNGFTNSSPVDAGGNDAVDSDGTSVTTNLSPGENDPTLDSGFYKLASLGDKVFIDANGNGIQDTGDAGLGGVTVELINPVNGNVIGTTTTDANGGYLFNNLTPGEYQVKFTPPSGYNFTSPNVGGDDSIDSDANVTTGVTQSVTLTSGEFNGTVDAGLVLQKASLGDFVWEDLDADGIQDAGEAGISGVTVQLKNSGGTVVQTTSTDANGKYLFDVTPGTYSVGVVAPNGFVVSPKDQGGNDAIDSDIDPTTLMTANTTIAAGQQNLTLDAGLFRKASLGDFVWNDCDSDGIQDANESGVAGVTVKLLNAAGGVAATTTTDSNGKYLFDNLTPGTYSAQFVAPVGSTFTLKDQGGNDALDSDVDPATGKTIQTVLESGENDLSWDAGLKFAKICADFNFNGNTPLDGTDGNIRNFTSNGISVNASAFSRDKATGSWATAYLGSYGGGLGVTDRSEGSGSGNTHTVDNTGGRDNYALFEFNTSVVLDKAFLGYVSGDSDLQVWIGNFNNPFSNHLNLNDLVLTSMGFTELNQTTLNSTRTADLNAGEFAGNTIVIAADTTDTTPEDFFKIQNLLVCTPGCPPDNTAKASIGDRVWEDKNANGIQDAGENGIAGVTVKLLNNQGQEVTSTLTNTNGNYNFTNLNPSDYQVQFVAPTGYTFSSQDQGGNDTLDSDANPTTGKTITTNLVAGENDTSWDAGLYRKASLGDFVWNDLDKDGIQDAGEAGISGVTVKLLNVNGTQVTTTTTGTNGSYNFSNLNPGTYSVQFVAPTDYTFSPANQGTDDAKDSDANVTNGKTQQVTLTSGEFNGTLDGGLYKVNVPCVPIDICLCGNTALDGTDGNLRTFSKNGLSVKASAFSRDKSNGSWSKAYLGAYGEGLGVTDSSEGNGGNGSHRVDNIGRDNYVLFEFSAPVSVDAAYLNSVVQDSDISVFIGNANDPFNNHLNLNDSILSSMTREENYTDSSYSRTADINASGMVGNTLVIAGSLTDMTPEDQFKINNLGVCAFVSDPYHVC